MSRMPRSGASHSELEAPPPEGALVPAGYLSRGIRPMKVIVFSNSSYANASVRLGLQIIASLLSERGHEVDYLAVPTHPLDVFSPTRRPSCIRSWMRRGDHHSEPVADRLREYFLRAPFPRSRKYWWFEKQIHLYTRLAPSWMDARRYDVCIRDTAMSGLFADKVSVKVRILRLNDNPDGLLNDVHPMVVDRLKSQVNARYFDEIWTITDSMLSRITGIDESVPSVSIPNGVFLDRFDAISSPRRKARSAVYLGTFNHWFDTSLLCRAARLLPDWRIDLYGPCKSTLRPLLALENVLHHGPLPFARVPEVLSEYRVGLLPFAGGKAILETMDPLKANQYLAAGLGIASTSHGSLGKSLAAFAHFGDAPDSFAAAVRSADGDCGELRKRKEVNAYLERVDWSTVLGKVECRLGHLVGRAHNAGR